MTCTCGKVTGYCPVHGSDPVMLGATMIGFSGNHRAMRFCLQQRTAESAEEEIRIVFGHIAREQANCYPNLYRDMKEEMVDGIERYTFENHKI